MTAREVVQFITSIVAIVGLLLWLRFYSRYPDRKYLVVAPLFYIIHTLIYYSAVAIVGLNPQILLFGNWSAALRLHGMITLSIMALQIYEECGKHGS